MSSDQILPKESSSNFSQWCHLDCERPEYIGDMFCDDITNTHECGMDEGDCCDPHSFFFACHHCVCFDMSEYEMSENAIDLEPSKCKSNANYC